MNPAIGIGSTNTPSRQKFNFIRELSSHLIVAPQS